MASYFPIKFRKSAGLATVWHKPRNRLTIYQRSVGFIVDLDIVQLDHSRFFPLLKAFKLVVLCIKKNGQEIADSKLRADKAPDTSQSAPERRHNNKIIPLAITLSFIGQHIKMVVYHTMFRSKLYHEYSPTLPRSPNRHHRSPAPSPTPCLSPVDV